MSHLNKVVTGFSCISVLYISVSVDYSLLDLQGNILLILLLWYAELSTQLLFNVLE